MRASIISLVLLAAVAFAAFWWQSIAPSNGRDWAPDVMRMTTGERAEELVTLHHVRNFTWRSETDIDERWETRRYDLTQLTSADLIVSYWTVPAIAHTLVSFGFRDGRHVVFSVEIRKEKGEEFSEIGGFLKRFELSIIAADERDIIGVRAAVRDEKVFLFRSQLNAADRRALFLAYVDAANRLAATPRFYNTLTANCTTMVFAMMERIIGNLPMDYRLLASGYLPNYVYDLGGLDTRYDFDTLERMGYISRRAKVALLGAEPQASVMFSRAIRDGIPSLPQSAP